MSKTKPTTKVIKASDLTTVFPGLGKTQEVRQGNATGWDIGSVMAEIESRGFDELAGPRPWAVEGEPSPRDGNRRLTALSVLAAEKPDLFGSIKVKVDIYPATLTEEERQELSDRAIRSTKPMTQKDLHHYVMQKVLKNPGISQLDLAKAVGVGTIRNFYPGAFNPDALEPDGLGGMRIKAGVPGSKVFKNKQGPIQTGIALAKAHPVVRELFFSEDPARFLDYRQVLEANAKWEADKAKNPGIVCATTIEDLAKQMPESDLLAFVGPILEHGRGTKAGRKPGEAAQMDTKTRLGLVNTFATCPPFVALLNLVNGAAGFNSEANMTDLEALGRIIVKSLPEEGKVIVDRIFARSAAAAKAQAEKLAGNK